MNGPTSLPLLTRPLRGLIWKESRQLLPLIAILIGTLSFLMVLWIFVSPTVRWFGNIGYYAPLGLPMLFAVGVGLILVSQEKEIRTMEWLVSFPVKPLHLISVKFLVAFAGLILMWILYWLLALGIPSNAQLPQLFGYGYRRGSLSSLSQDHVLLVIHSVLILVGGFYAAWRIRRPLASVIAIIPLAIMPILVVELGYMFRGWLNGARIISIPPWPYVALTLAVIPLYGVLAYRAARRSLMPAEPPRLDGHGDRLFDAWRPPPQSAPELPYRFSISSMVWQSIHQNAWVLAGISAMILSGLAAVAFHDAVDAGSNQQAFIVFGSLIGAMGVCWLGVLAFAGDGSSERIRFLAERGVSPTQAWLGRHLVGISILSIGLLSYTVSSYWVVSQDLSHGSSQFSVAMVAIVLGVGYSVSQWTSHLVRMFAVSSVLAPLLSLVLAVWVIDALFTKGMPMWLLLLCIALPMVATWLTMGRFMDGKRGVATWGISVATVGLLMVLPIVPILVLLLESPCMDTDTRARLTAEAQEAWRSERSTASVTLAEQPGLELDFQENMSGKEALEIVQQRSYQPQDYLLMPRATVGNEGFEVPTPLRCDLHVVVQTLWQATYQSFRYENSPDDETEIESLGNWIATLSRFAKGLRRSRRWVDQEHADRIEIWLTRRLSSDEFQPLLDRQFAVDAMERLTDRDGRNRSRRRAVLASWHQAQFDLHESSHFGGLTIDETEYQHYGLFQERFRKRFRETLVRTALQLIDAGSQGNPTEPALQSMHELVFPPTVTYFSGPYGPGLRCKEATRIDEWHPHHPAVYWYRPWENEAMRLKQDHSKK